MSNTNPGPAVTSSGSLVGPIGNIEKYAVLSLALTPVAVAVNTTAEQSFTVPGCGIVAGDFIAVNKPSAQAGLGIVGARATGIDTFAITFVNATAAIITPTAGEVYLVKDEKVIGGAITSFPY